MCMYEVPVWEIKLQIDKIQAIYLLILLTLYREKWIWEGRISDKFTILHKLLARVALNSGNTNHLGWDL